MTKKNTPTTLSDIQVFSALSKAELRSMCRLMAAVNVKEGRLLTREGEPGREFMIILEGQATVRRKGKLLATLSPGDFSVNSALLLECLAWLPLPPTPTWCLKH